jgi:leucyl-tRNA synthetase
LPNAAVTRAFAKVTLPNGAAAPAFASGPPALGRDAGPFAAAHDKPPPMSSDERPRYAPAEIEPKWQKIWAERQTFRAVRHEGRAKRYILDMFPYPSGAGLHVGHPEGYTATDIVSRFERMRGKDVLHPMGWDAFGLPAEQHAIRTGQHPRKTTQENITVFKRQLQALGFSYDWSREVDTTDAGYVRWTQWIFLQLFKKGLAFQSEVPVNWCPELGTVLANEEVVDGKSDIGGHPVERRPLRQWMLQITAYADRLDEDLAILDWPETKAKQHSWIGRSVGAEVEFEVEGHADKRITVFTTRVDTLSGATYVVLAPEHPLVEALVSQAQRVAVATYVEIARTKTEIDRSDVTKTKSGVDLGARAKNPINGQKLPIWVADYVIGTYGTGAVMAVPAHDERDHAFARAYGLPIVAVVAPADGHAIDVRDEAFTDDGVAFGVSGHLAIPNGTPSAEVREKTSAWLESKGQGRAKVTYHLRDWVFSRQRYWGEPIPIYFPVETAGDPRQEGTAFTIRYDQPIAVDEADLPVKLPELEDFRPSSSPSGGANDAAGPLGRVRDWRFFQKGGEWFARETNTMPQWAGSCWYYLRFLDPKNDKEPFSKAAYDAWMPVDLYVGGTEHAVLHLLYARFWHKVLYDIGVVSDPEPFIKLVHQGMILGEDSQKMSKSRGNVINPEAVIKTHGADALRVYEMFMGPLEQTKPWQSAGIEGSRRFLDRAWNVTTGELTKDPAAYDDATRRLVHKTVKKVGEDIEAMRFNTAISAMMILVKHLGGLPAVPVEAARTFALLLSPFAPHLGEELWQKLGAAELLAYEPWPTFDPALVKDDVVEIGIQVNGKLRGTVMLPVAASADDARAAALAEANVAAHVAGKTVKKLVYVPGKIVNFIVG